MQVSIKKPFLKILVQIVPLALLLALVPLHEVHAGLDGVFGTIGDAILDGVISLIETAVFGLLGAIASLLTLILEFMVGILDYLMSPTFNNGIIRQPFVQTGWSIIRDFANMFFVVILVIVAVATIIRQENFGIRRILPTLIIIALLINFSLLLVGFVIDVSQIFMIYFMSAFEEQGFGTVLANAANFDKIFTGSIAHTKDIGTWEELGIRFLLKILTLFALMFELFIIATLSVLFIIRTVVLWIVAILAPLAFLAYILPATRQGWNTWLKTLTNWALFGPVAMFYLWLVGLLAENMQGAMSSFGTGAAGLGQSSGGNEFLGDGVAFIQAAAIFVFLFLAINSAKSFTGSVGNMVARKVEGYGRGAVGIATAPGRFAGRKTKEAAQRKGAEEAAKRLGRPAGRGAQFAESVAAGEHALGKLPLGMGWAARGIARQAKQPLRDYEARAGAMIDKKQKDIERNKDEAVIGAAKAAAEPLEQVAAFTETAKRGLLNAEKFGYTKDEEKARFKDKIRDVMDRAGQYDKAKELEKARPDVMIGTRAWQQWEQEVAPTMTPEEFTEERQKRMDDHMKKYTRADAAKLGVEALSDPVVQRGIMRTWGTNQAVGLVQEGSNDQIKAFENAVRNMTEAAGDFDATLQMIETDVGKGGLGGFGNKGLAKALEKNPILSALDIRPGERKEKEDKKKKKDDEDTDTDTGGGGGGGPSGGGDAGGGLAVVRRVGAKRTAEEQEKRMEEAGLRPVAGGAPTPEEEIIQKMQREKRFSETEVNRIISDQPVSRLFQRYDRLQRLKKRGGYSEQKIKEEETTMEKEAEQLGVKDSLDKFKGIYETRR